MNTSQKVALLGSLAGVLSIKKHILKKNRKTRKTKRYWVHPLLLMRNQQGYYNNLMKEMKMFHPYMYYNFTRLSPTLFDKLLSIIGPRIEKNSLRESIPTGCRLAITLRFLATGDSYPSLSYAFRVGVSTICNIVRETCEVLWEELNPLVLSVPVEAELSNTSKEFARQWSLPNCVGAIDGKHVIIQAPSNSGSSYFNYKKSFSIVLLAVCDANYCFSYVDIGAYGSQSDGGILNKSTFGQKLLSNKLPLPEPSVLPLSDDNKKMPYFFVGDEAFPLRMNIMRPYSKPRNGTMPDDIKIFNYRLSRARRVIENTFGILTARFRIYHRVINAAPKTVDSIVSATVCLHNFIRKEKYDLYFNEGDVDRECNAQVLPGRWRTEVPESGTALEYLAVRIGARNATVAATEMRNELKSYLNGVGSALAPWQLDVIHKTN